MQQQQHMDYTVPSATNLVFMPSAPTNVLSAENTDHSITSCSTEMLLLFSFILHNDKCFIHLCFESICKWCVCWKITYLQILTLSSFPLLISSGNAAAPISRRSNWNMDREIIICIINIYGCQYGILKQIYDTKTKHMNHFSMRLYGITVSNNTFLCYFSNAARKWNYIFFPMYSSPCIIFCLSFSHLHFTFYPLLIILWCYSNFDTNSSHKSYHRDSKHDGYLLTILKSKQSLVLN